MAERELFTADEAATFLGVSRATFYNHIREAGLTGLRRIGDRKVYYRAEAVEVLGRLRPVERSKRRRARYEA